MDAVLEIVIIWLFVLGIVAFVGAVASIPHKPPPKFRLRDILWPK